MDTDGTDPQRRGVLHDWDQADVTAPPIASDQTITDYLYQNSCDSGATWWGGDAQATTSPFTASAARFGAKYAIAAVINGTWDTPYSNPVTVDPLTAPTLVGASYDGSSGGILTVSPPPIAADQTITDYIYQISCDGGTSWSTVDALATTSPFTASGCYGAQYMIAAVINGTWYSPYSNPVTVDPLTAPTLAGASYDGSSGGILTVSPPAIAADQTITDYIYQISCDGGTSWSTVDALASTSPLYVSFCGAGATSTYKVIALVDGWETPISNDASFYVPPPPPPPSSG